MSGFQRTKPDSIYVSVIVHDKCDDLIALDMALEKMGAIDERKVQLATLRHFVGKASSEAAELRGISNAVAVTDRDCAAFCLMRSDFPSQEPTSPHFGR